jgi:hypothetical protein
VNKIYSKGEETLILHGGAIELASFTNPEYAAANLETIIANREITNPHPKGYRKKTARFRAVEEKPSTPFLDIRQRIPDV